MMRKNNWPLQALAMALLTWASCQGMAASPSQPNFVLLLADDWGFSDVGAFGSEIATPHLDELARVGTRFSNFHVAASCSPTRAMLLTGVDNHRNGVGNMRETIPQSHVGKPGYLSVLNRNVVTVASLLKDAGYRTYVAGKWHVGKEPHNLPPARGFDRSLVQGDSGSDNWETGKRYLDLADKVYWYEDGKPAKMPTDYYSSEYFVDQTIKYLKQDQASKQPFFAYVAFQANHIPVQAPQSFIDKYQTFYHEGWSALRQSRRDKAAQLGLIPPNTPMVDMATTENWQALTDEQRRYQAKRMQVYAAMAEAMDHQVGRLIAHLKATGQYDNTVFVFLSDNGAEASDPYAITVGRWWLKWQYTHDVERLGSKGSYGIIGPSWASAAASPLSTYKFYSGEGGIRVPLIISSPASRQAATAGRQGTINSYFTHVKDISPTLLEMAQVATPGDRYKGQVIEPITGKSLVPVLSGTTERAHAADEAIGYELSGNQALFKGDLKLIRNIPPVGDGQWHLYDIRNDPGETQDLQHQIPLVFQEMQQAYGHYAKANGVLEMPPGYDPIQQVLINSLVNVYVPRFQWPVLALFALGLGYFGLRRWRTKKALGHQKGTV